MSKEKVTVEERIEAAKVCAEGRMSQSEAARRLGVDRANVREWTERYKAQGILGFRKQEHNSVYPEERKETAVREYLERNGIIAAVLLWQMLQRFILVLHQ